MKKFFALKNSILPVIIGFTMNGFTQVAGDFQTKAPAGNWSDFNAWNVYTGSVWIAATTGQIPTATTSVFVQAAHTISIDNASAVCNDLDLNGAVTSKIDFLSAGILNVKGNMNLFSTSHNCFGSWIAGAKIVFSGTGAQGFTNLSANSAFINIEVNKSSGNLTTSSSFRFGSFTLTGGNFLVGSGTDVQGTSGTAAININGGAWIQTGGSTRIFSIPVATPSSIGALTINGGAMILSTSNMTGGFLFSTINVLNGGTFTLNNFSGDITIGTSISVDATSTFNTALMSLVLPPGISFNGIVNYNKAGAQIINAATYTYLKLSGIGIKTLETGTTYIPANGTLEMSGVSTSPTLISGGALNISATGTNLIYSSTGRQTAGTADWNANFQNVIINNAAGVSMAGLTRTVSGSLSLTNGTLDIGAGGSLTLDGAPLNRTNGFIGGTSTSDLAITGATGSTVLLPLLGNISLRNITGAGNRTLAMDGLHNINLYGILNIGSTAAYDNGGESQITQGPGSSIVINGKFINRDKDNFTGPNGAIPGIIPSLNTGCTIEYGLAGNQVITAKNNYQNITFSGSGTKTLANTFAPLLNVYITGSAVVYAGHNFGDNGTPPFTNLKMDGGRLILVDAGTQPCMTGIYTLTGGVVEFASSQLTTQSIRSRSYQNIEVTGNNVGNSTGNITLNATGTFAVKTGGSFEINDNSITGSGGTQVVTVENGGIFITGNNEGFNGYPATLTNNSSVHQNITSINLNAGSTVEYIRMGDQPITNANGLIYSNVLLSGSGNKTAPAGILTVNGNLLKSGTSTFIHSGGTVFLNGPAQSFAGLTYNNLILSGNIKTTSGNSTIVDSIKINTGTTLSISAADTITLHSDAIKTARMAQVDGSINYNTTGKFVVERYISPKRAWRFLSVPVNSSQTIKQAWQEDALNSTSNPVPGFGTQITSNRTSWLADGFDAFSAGGPSMKTYNPVTNDYTGIATTVSSFLPALGGYMTFVRGDRTANTFASPATSTVLRTKGLLYTGPQAPITVVAGQITPYNNPYAAPLDLRKIAQSNSVFFYVWDPNRGGAYGLGAFQTLSWNGSGYDVLPGGSSSYPGNIGNFVESGQAFLVSGGAISLPLNETKKGIGSGAMVFRPASAPQQKLHSNLFSINADSSTFLADGVLNIFDDTYSNEVDGMDAKKLANFGENLAIKVADKLLVIERRHTITQQDTIFFNLTGTRIQAYQFQFNAENIKGVEGFLEDNYLHTRTPLNIGGTTIVNFNVLNIAGSYAADRFRIVFAPSVVLPVTFTSVKAYRQDRNINVEWRVENEINVKQYEVEKSFNGTQFTTLAIVPATANNGNSAVYLSADTRPVEGYNYYRVKGVDINGKIAYTEIVKVLMGSLKQDITIYPNPITDGMIHLQFQNQPEGKYGIRLLNKLGQIIMFKQISHAGESSTELIKWNYNLANGMYQLEVTRPDKTQTGISVTY